MCFPVLYEHILICNVSPQSLLVFSYSPVKLPDGRGSLNHEDLFFPYSCDEDPYHGPVMPVSAIAGLVGDKAETFVVATRFIHLLFQVIIAFYAFRC